MSVYICELYDNGSEIILVFNIDYGVISCYMLLMLMRFIRIMVEINLVWI